MRALVVGWCVWWHQMCSGSRVLRVVDFTDRSVLLVAILAARAFLSCTLLGELFSVIKTQDSLN